MITKFLDYFYGSFFSLIIGVFTTPIITRLYQPEEYAKYSMFNLMCQLAIIIIVFGLDQSFIRNYYEIKIKERIPFLFQCMKYSLIIFLIQFLGFYFYKEAITNYFMSEYSLTLVVIVVINTFLLAVNRFLMTYIRMMQIGKMYSLIQLGQKISYLILLMIVFKLNFLDYRALIVATTFSSLVVFLISSIVIFSKKKSNEISTNETVKSKTIIKKSDILKYSYPFVFSVSLNWLFQSIDRLAIKEYSTLKELGYYAAAFSIIRIIVVIKDSFVMFWTPIVLEKYKDKEKAKDFFIQSNQFISYLFLMIGTGVILLNYFIISLLGPEYKYAVVCIPFLVFMPIMYSISETTVIGINLTKRTNWHVLISVVCCFVNAVGNLILVPNLGAVGASIATAISYIFFFSIRTYISYKLYKVEFKIAKIFGSVLILFAYAFLVYQNINGIIHYIFGMLSIVMISLLYRSSIIFLISNLNQIFSKKQKMSA